MKYIIFERPDLLPTAVIFDVNVDHSVMANKIGFKVLSAGQIHFGPDVMHCVNGSVTMSMSYNAAQSTEDSHILQRLSDL